MKALRVLFAAIWLLFGISITAHAMPVTDVPPCHGESHHDKPLKTVMACCAHPAPLQLPAPIVWSEPVEIALQLEPAEETLLAGLSPAAEPRPPKHV